MTVAFAAAAAVICMSGGALGAAVKSHSKVVGKVRIWRIAYRAHNGARREAFVAFPSSYRPRHAPPIPLVISPHGRGVTGREGRRAPLGRAPGATCRRGRSTASGSSSRNPGVGTPGTAA